MSENDAVNGVENEEREMSRDSEACIPNSNGPFPYADPQSIEDEAICRVLRMYGISTAELFNIKQGDS